MKKTEAIAQLETLLTPDFLARLSEVTLLAKAMDETGTFYAMGWYDMDWYAVANFVEGLHEFAGVEVQGLDTVELEDDAC